VRRATTDVMGGGMRNGQGLPPNLTTELARGAVSPPGNVHKGVSRARRTKVSRQHQGRLA